MINAEIHSRILTVVLGLLCLVMQACTSKETTTVTVYTSQDQVYAEPILAEFTRETGINTRVLYDSESVKTVGLANRLLAERGNPQCDVFWNNEEFRTRQLAAKDVFRAANGWKSFGFRTRRIVVNTNRISIAEAPRTLRELTRSVWYGKVALAYPLFGTTATHFLALRDAWGDTEWEQWCRDLQANRPFVVDGNSVVVKLVGQGEAWVGLTDSDDIEAGRREGYPIASIPLHSESLAIPNTVAVVRGAPHARNAQRLYEYLQQSNVIGHLVRRSALEGSIRPGPHTTQPDWDALLADLNTTTIKLKEIFLR